MLSEKYGWTPSQIREQSYDDLMAYIDIGNVKTKIENQKSKKIKNK